MVFDGSSEFRPGIEEAYDSGVVFCEDLDDCWRTEDSWGWLMTELFNGGETNINSDENLLFFEWQSLQLKHRLSRGVFCEDMDDCWKTYDSWVGLITELFNVVGTVITSDDNSFLF